MEVEVYILNQEQIDWFELRYLSKVPQILVTKVNNIRCIEKEYLGQEGLEDVVNYISEQEIEITTLIIESKPKIKE